MQAVVMPATEGWQRPSPRWHQATRLKPSSGSLPILTRNVIDSMVPEGIYAFKIDLWATSNMFQAGHRIGLYVSSSEFPTYELNPNTGVRITHDLSGDTAVATQLVHHDATHASRLILPIIPA